MCCHHIQLPMLQVVVSESSLTIACCQQFCWALSAGELHSSLGPQMELGRLGKVDFYAFCANDVMDWQNRRTDRTAVTSFHISIFVVEIPLFIFRAAWESVWLFDGSRGCHWESCNQQRPITPNSPKKHKSTKSCFNGFNWNQNGLQRTPVRFVQLSSNSNLKEHIFACEVIGELHKMYSDYCP